MEQHLIIPVLGILTGLIIPIAVFVWLYFEGKGKRDTVLEISKHLDDPQKLEELLKIFEDRKKISYRLSKKWSDHNFCRYRSLPPGLCRHWLYSRGSRSISRYNRCRNFDSWIPLPKYWERIDRCSRRI